MDTRTNFTIFMILSEIVITAIAFIGAYYIFKPIINKNKKDVGQTEEKSETNNMDQEKP